MLHMWQGDWQQMGVLPGFASGRIHRRVGYTRRRNRRLFLFTNSAIFH